MISSASFCPGKRSSQRVDNTVVSFVIIPIAINAHPVDTGHQSLLPLDLPQSRKIGRGIAAC
jgi:hypothetical protein